MTGAGGLCVSRSDVNTTLADPAPSDVFITKKTENKEQGGPHHKRYSNDTESLFLSEEDTLHPFIDKRKSKAIQFSILSIL